MHSTLPFQTFVVANELNTALVGKQLPVSSFVGFDTFKLKNTELAWLNTDLLSELDCNLSIELAENAIVKNYSYVSLDYTTLKDINIGDKKVFLADRYGSRYEACNGGSARCGMNGQFQVKGIGRNPLVSENIDYNHSHGKLCLAEAVNEAIWGEICHQHLPYGAVRTLAIIKTNILIKTNYGLGEDVLQPCALAIRQPAVRPAHFERATFFWPQAAHIHLRDHDYIRVQESIENMKRAFVIDAEDREIVLENDTFLCLLSFVKRIARQIGTSRVKGIPHGSLTSSNISIDGRFLDFGTISSVPDFSNYILAGGQGGVWDDHLLIAEWIRHLYFFVNKYNNQKLSKEMQDLLIERFFYELEKTENIETAKLLGIKTSTVEQAAIGGKLKQFLCAAGKVPRAFVGFDSINFEAQIKHVAKNIGISVIPAFTLRNVRYSQHTIASKTAAIVSNSNGNRDAISALIDDYIQVSTKV
jgi:hypothetical protein